jgi:hypothetical protein
MFFEEKLTPPTLAGEWLSPEGPKGAKRLKNLL